MSGEIQRLSNEAESRLRASADLMQQIADYGDANVHALEEMLNAKKSGIQFEARDKASIASDDASIRGVLMSFSRSLPVAAQSEKWSVVDSSGYRQRSYVYSFSSPDFSQARSLDANLIWVKTTSDQENWPITAGTHVYKDKLRSFSPAYVVGKRQSAMDQGKVDTIDLLLAPAFREKTYRFEHRDRVDPSLIMARVSMRAYEEFEARAQTKRGQMVDFNEYESREKNSQFISNVGTGRWLQEVPEFPRWMRKLPPTGASNETYTSRRIKKLRDGLSTYGLMAVMEWDGPGPLSMQDAISFDIRSHAYQLAATFDAMDSFDKTVGAL